jgi:dTDP-4-dehydrorhamnose 3,5-epimerase
MTFTFKRLQISDVILIEPELFSDNRGFFLETFKESDFLSNGISKKFVQDNFSHSIHGVIRGLHYQNSPKAQAKLITVVKGEIFDVAVDIRKNSPTYGRWVSEILSESNHRSLYIPEGFAHGFCVLSEKADVFYKTSNEYSREHEGGVIWNDSTINISWPIEKPIISSRDSRLPLLEDLNNDFTYQETN